jgi:hypothetical protein
MTHVQFSEKTLGATRQSWQALGPRALLRMMMQQMPSGKEEYLLEKFSKRAKESPKILDEIIEYWFTNNYRSLKMASSPREGRAATQAIVAQKTAELSAVVERHIEKEVNIKFYALMMPNGKTLAGCTKADCKQLSAKMGPWLATVAAKVRVGKTVADCLSEPELAKLYRTSK